MAPSLDQLQAEADAISPSSPKIRAFCRDVVAYLKANPPAPAPAPAPAPTPTTPVPVGALLFSDDFTGPLDLTKWDVKAHGTWLPANVSVGNGLLSIAATLDAAGVWHGGELQSLAPAYQYVGPRYMECRAVVPKGEGTWSAPLWEWGAPWGENHVEIDVCEQLGVEPTKYHVTVHPNGSESRGIVIDTGVVLSDAFHRYGAAVYADRVDAYFDGRIMGTITNAGLTAWPFLTTPMCAVVDLAMGGWGGAISVSPPVHMLNEYVKVWRAV